MTEEGRDKERGSGWRKKGEERPPKKNPLKYGGENGSWSMGGGTGEQVEFGGKSLLG